MPDEKRYSPTARMRDLVKDNHSLIMVMSRFGIPLGFGEQNVRDVCLKNGVDVSTFLTVANFCSGYSYSANEISLTSLTGYLKHSHEYYLNFLLPSIRRRLIESINCNGNDEIAMLILKFFDEYVAQVQDHMEMEDKVLFSYVDGILHGMLCRTFSIDDFCGKHPSINAKVKELKDIIIRYCPQNNSWLLSNVLLEIINTEEDMNLHCQIEDEIFIPAVKEAESRLKCSDGVNYRESITGNESLPQLSDREKDILRCVAKGLSNKEIAETLYISVNTVATHRRNISAKLGLHTSTGFVIYALAHKLVKLDDIT
ncbi:MAG: LuxR C-terminal-related transcriptional regulator [Candidatus Cryptobacteroides sp.]